MQAGRVRQHWPGGFAGGTITGMQTPQIFRSKVLPGVRAATVLAACATLALCVHAQEKRGRKYKAPPPVAKVTVTVTRASNGKPVENAAVIFHTVHDGKDQGNMELKTNEDGKASLEVIPVGDQVQLQVFKAGFQTYGEDFQLDTASRDFDIKLKNPSGQYSTYQKTPVDQNGKQSVTPQPSEGAAKPAPKPY